MYVVFLYGPPASGKYTIGELVAGQLDIPLFHNHLTVDLVGSLFEFGTPEFVAMREKIWLEAFAAAATSGQSFVFTFNPESTVSQVTIDRLEKKITGNAGRIFYVELICPEDEIERRITNKSRKEFGKLTDLDQYRELRESGVFNTTMMPESAFEIDTSGVSPDEAAKLVVRHVESYRKDLD